MKIYEGEHHRRGFCKFDMPDGDGKLGGDWVRWGACALWLETWERNAKFSVVDGSSVLDVEWVVAAVASDTRSTARSRS